MTNSKIFTNAKLGGLEFKNRILRSSVGGRNCNWDGTVTDVWRSFEKRFADAGVGGIISTTFHVTQSRLSPPQYPSIATGDHAKALNKYLPQIKGEDCKYIVQLGDPGYATYSSLFPQVEDSKSSSSGFDAAFGYNNCRTEMSDQEIKEIIGNFVSAAKRVQDAGADGIEITAAKGYLIHQFLNPGFNRRDDDWGGSVDNRFRLLREIIERVRQTVGDGYPLGVRLAAADHNYLPLQLALLRHPWNLLSQRRWRGNDEDQMLAYAHQLKGQIDFLHIVSGYGFPNPRVVPGAFPLDEIKIFFNSTRHLSGKAAARSIVLNLLPVFFSRWLMNLGWRYVPAINLDAARRFRSETGIPVIVNGGLQEKADIETALDDCDMVSMARAIIANPGLIKHFEAEEHHVNNPCSFCNRCVGRTATSPLGCYDPCRFSTIEEMQEQILEWNRP